jgi:hypothetical protein
MPGRYWDNEIPHIEIKKSDELGRVIAGGAPQHGVS